jgi:acyl-ACP thioesterase
MTPMAPSSDYSSSTTDSLAVGLPETGRTYSIQRRVGLAEVSPRGRARLDGLARLLQDVADEDVSAAGLHELPARAAARAEAHGWVVRRTEQLVTQFPVFREQVTLTTWGSGIGGRWAERRTTIRGEWGGHVEAASLWVHLDLATMRPAPLPESFLAVYGPPSGGRKVRANLHHGKRPVGVGGTPWPLRFADFDVMAHVNNAKAWEPIEEAWAEVELGDGPVRASVEHPAAIERGAALTVVTQAAAGGLDQWLVDRDTVCATTSLRVGG